MKEEKEGKMVICRKCHHQYLAWTWPFCRFCWKKFFKNKYIPTKQEIIDFCA